MIIVPSLQLCWTLFGVIGGMLFFREHEGMSALNTAMFVLGVGIVCFGAFMLTQSRQHYPDSQATGTACGSSSSSSNQDEPLPCDAVSLEPPGGLAKRIARKQVMQLPTVVLDSVCQARGPAGGAAVDAADRMLWGSTPASQEVVTVCGAGSTRSTRHSWKLGTEFDCGCSSSGGSGVLPVSHSCGGYLVPSWSPCLSCQHSACKLSELDKLQGPLMRSVCKVSNQCALHQSSHHGSPGVIGLNGW